MAVDHAKERVLALDVRSSRCGFAAFDGPRTLLDFGARSYSRKSGSLKAVARKQFIKLLKLHAPTLIVVRSAVAGSRKTRARAKLLVSTLRQIGRNRSVRLRFLSRRQVKAFFQAQALPTKYAVASQLAERYSELGWMLRPQRRMWEPEHPQMIVFDATATGAAYFKRPIVRTS